MTDAKAQGKDSPPTPEISRDQEREVLISLLVAQDSARWQGPGLAIAAHSFLLTIALGKDATTAARIIATILALFTAFAAFYLVSRKTLQVNEIKGRIESRLGPGDLPIEKFQPELSENGQLEKKDWNLVSTFRASAVWMFVLSTFMIADIVIFVMILQTPSPFSAP